jgi:hypothetical protein
VRNVCRAAAVIAFVVVAAPARAQIYNVQPLLDGHKNGFATAIEGSLDWREGNTDLLLLSGNAATQWRHGRHLLFLLLHDEVGLKQGVQFVNKDLEHLRYRVLLDRVFDAEAFVQHDADAFRRLAVRAVAGVGLRLRIVAGRHVDIAVAAAHMVEYEHLAASVYPDSDEQRIKQRLSTYLVATIKTTARFNISDTLYAQPSWVNFHDVKMLSDSAFQLVVSKHVSVKFDLLLTLDTQPPYGVQPLDSELKTTLSMSW